MNIKSILPVLFILFSFNVFAQHTVIDKLQNTSDIKVVWEVTTDNMEDGIGAGLLYPEKQFQRYEFLGVPKENYKLSVVLHGDAGKFLVNDEVYKKVTKSADPNPNKDQVAKLIGQGVSVELCIVTMQVNGWTENDLLPGVTILGTGAYPRIIDLQYQGYKYIRF
jgi:intracellular sulfur oxidation DsrE/DsrF family protein